MQIKRMKVSELKGASYNPKSRSSPKAVHLRRLEKSIEKVGLIYPIAVSPDGTVIDGHRRLQAVKNLGWEEIPVIVVKCDEPDLVFAEVNAASSRLSGSQNLQVFMKNPAAVTDRMRGQFDRYQEAFGRTVLVRLSKEGMSVRIITLALRACKYMENDSPAFAKKTVLWMVKHRNARVVESFLQLQQPPKSLYGAIVRGSDLRVVYQE